MRRAFKVAPIFLLFSVAALAATPADFVRSRVAGYRALGAAFKAANDTVRAGDLRAPRLQQAAGQIVAASQRQYKWFPKGSATAPGVKSAARPEIWTQPAEFRAAQDGFARQAVAFQRAVGSGDERLVRSEARKLGAQCKGCHDRFRVAND